MQTEPIERRKGTVYYLYLFAGFTLTGIGIAGIFLPLLPTTIFLILASACFMKSSPKLAEKLKNSRLLGSYLRNYQDKTGLTMRSKIAHITVVLLSISVTAIWLTDSDAIRILLAVIAVGVSLHLALVKTAKA
jgi:uncharacterized membrane protein YbaN (DUF454 family)